MKKLPDWKTTPNEEKLEIIEPHRLKGASSTEIAMLFSNCTRNSVIGLMTRKKLPLLAVFTGGRREGHATSPKVQKKAKRIVNNVTAMGFQDKSAGGHEVEIKVIVDKPRDRLMTLLELKPGNCKWPVGDPRDPGFGFCGDHAPEGRSYCRLHQIRSTRSL